MELSRFAGTRPPLETAPLNGDQFKESASTHFAGLRFFAAEMPVVGSCGQSQARLQEGHVPIFGTEALYSSSESTLSSQSHYHCNNEKGYELNSSLRWY